MCFRASARGGVFIGLFELGILSELLSGCNRQIVKGDDLVSDLDDRAPGLDGHAAPFFSRMLRICGGVFLGILGFLATAADDGLIAERRSRRFRLLLRGGKLDTARRLGGSLERRERPTAPAWAGTARAAESPAPLGSGSEAEGAAGVLAGAGASSSGMTAGAAAGAVACGGGDPTAGATASGRSGRSGRPSGFWSAGVCDGLETCGFTAG